MPQVMGRRSYEKAGLNVDNSRHITRGKPPLNPERVTEGFAAALNSALGKVEALDVRSQKLTTQAIYDPNSVEAHQVIVAAEKARFALNLTKTLADGFIRGYRELTRGQ